MTIHNGVRLQLRTQIRQLPTWLKLLGKSTLLPVGLMLCAQFSPAQITNEIKADITHSFIIGNTTFAPGTYVFRVLPDSDLGTMTITSEDGKASAEFLVREGHAKDVPQHSELVFMRYGNKDFLSRVFEQGSRIGSDVTEVSRQEERLQEQSTQPTEHSEVTAGTE